MPGKSVAQKLLIEEGYQVLLIDAPKCYLSALRAECPQATISAKKTGEVDLIQLFVSSDAELRKILPTLTDRLRPKGLLWVTYPKGTSGIAADLNRDTIRKYAGTVGLQVVSVIAVDEVWSALRLKVV
jgi:hypothetical protein